MSDPQKENLKIGKGFPAQWLSRVETLLKLKGEPRCHALTIFAFNLNWFFVIDPIWTEKNFLSLLDKSGDNQDAIWAGFFWSARIPNIKLYVRMKSALLNLAKQKSITKRRHSEILSSILLAGWGSANPKNNKKYISDAEMREILIGADDDFRSHIIWQINRWNTDKPDKKNDWRSKILPFFSKVWPRHKKLKTTAISARLVELAFSSKENFSKIADAILPLVGKIDEQQHFSIPELRRSKNNIINARAEKVLALLYAVLPEDVRYWPYEINKTLEQIGVAKPSLLTDARLIELKRRWNAR